MSDNHFGAVVPSNYADQPWTTPLKSELLDTLVRWQQQPGMLTLGHIFTRQDYAETAIQLAQQAAADQQEWRNRQLAQMVFGALVLEQPQFTERVRPFVDAARDRTQETNPNVTSAADIVNSTILENQYAARLARATGKARPAAPAHT